MPLVLIMIKLNTSLAGDNYSYAPGEIIELDSEFEKRLIQSGQAEEVKPVKKKASVNADNK